MAPSLRRDEHCTQNCSKKYLNPTCARQRENTLGSSMKVFARAREVEHRGAAGVEAGQCEQARYGGAGHLADTPVRADQVPHVQNVETQLEVVQGGGAEREVLKDPEIHVVVPRVHRPGPLGDLAPVGRRRYLSCSMKASSAAHCCCGGDVRPAAAWRSRGEEDLALVRRDVDQVVAARAVAVNIAGINEGVAVAAGARETISLAISRNRPIRS